MQRVSGDETAAGGTLRQEAVKVREIEGPAGQTLKNFINSIKLNIFWNPETEFPGKIESLENTLMSLG